MSGLAVEDLAIVQAWGIEDYDPTTQKDLVDVAKALHKMDEAWGFVVFKTWGYKTAEKHRWKEFWERWNEVTAAKLRDMGATRHLEESVAGMLLWRLVDHGIMDGRGFGEGRECFAELVEEAEEHIPLGLDLDLALMADKASVDSLLDGHAQPFVWGVDVNHEDDGEDEGDGDGDDYPGHFKIATDVLIPELWHTLDAESPENLYPGPEKIYRGIIGQLEDAIAADQARLPKSPLGCQTLT